MQYSLSMINDKLYFLITTQKVASTWVLKYYNTINFPNQPPGLEELYNPNLYWNEKGERWEISPRKKGESKHLDKFHKDALSTFNNWIDGKLTKDVVILIREPNRRWESAFIQDYLKGFFHSWEQHVGYNMRTILKSSKFSKPEILEAWTDNPYNFSSNGLNDLLNNPTVNNQKFNLQCEGVKVLIKEYLLQAMNDSHHIWTHHNKLYHTIILQLLYEIKEKNNVRIIDIDKSSLQNAMNKYEVGNSDFDHGIHNQAGLYRKLLREVLHHEIQTYPEFENFGIKLTSQLQSEIHSYNILSKYRDKNFDI